MVCNSTVLVVVWFCLLVCFVGLFVWLVFVSGCLFGFGVVLRGQGEEREEETGYQAFKTAL